MQAFFLALSLVHHAVIARGSAQSGNSEHIRFKSLYKDEEAQLMFAESFGFKFQERKKCMLTVWEQGTPRRFEELKIKRIKYKGSYLTVSILKPFDSQDATIYFKGPLNTLIPFLKDKKNLVELRNQNF